VAQEVDLFDVKRKTLRMKPQAQPGLMLAVQRLLGLYREGYEHRFHEPPVILKRDGPILRGLVQQFGEAKVAERLAAFLRWDDQFIVESGYALTVFHSNWNRLTARVVAAQPAQREMSAERTSDYLRSLRAGRR
jgi:hypothetical protein